MATKNYKALKVTDLDKVKQILANAALDSLKSPNLNYTDIRLEASEGIGSYSEDGMPKVTSMDWGLSLGIRVIAGKKVKAAGYYGKQLGLADFANFSKVLTEAIKIAYERAKTNSNNKEKFITSSSFLGKSVTSTQLAPVEIIKTKVEAQYEIDPRKVSQKEITEFVCNAASKAKNYHKYIKRVEAIVNTGISRQVFASSQGALIDQWQTSSGGTVFIVAANDKGDKPADLYHHTGNQLGFEALTKGKNAHKAPFEKFACGIAQETVELADAKPAPQTKEVTVVLDPDLLALFAHEIIGHPSELDRAMKMEAGYAGRSWLMKDLDDNMVGKQVGSKMLTAFSDPTLKGGYGHYLYDDEGTPAKRVYHIKDGIYQDFMNSRQTAAVAGKEPNGHYKANDACVVPLIRMSASAIEGGVSDPNKIIAEVDDGFYAVGHHIPSISESRENFQIKPRLIYKIRKGKIAECYRDGRITADSKDFFMSIDALGNDFQIFPVPNCGKGQPMQAKQVGNGGPTARARAKIARGN